MARVPYAGGTNARSGKEVSTFATADDIARLTALLGHAPRSYRDFAKGAAAQWIKG